jgi:hypothetical protein
MANGINNVMAISMAKYVNNGVIKNQLSNVNNNGVAMSMANEKLISIIIIMA